MLVVDHCNMVVTAFLHLPHIFGGQNRHVLSVIIDPSEAGSIGAQCVLLFETNGFFVFVQGKVPFGSQGLVSPTRALFVVIGESIVGCWKEQQTE
jgi:hypothetical protein